MDAAIMLQRRMGKTRAINFYDCTVGIWGGENFMSDVLEGGANLLILWGPALNSKLLQPSFTYNQRGLKKFWRGHGPPNA